MGHRLLWGRPTTPPVAILPFAWCLLFLSLAAQTPSATNPPPPGSRFQLSLPNDASSLLSLAFCLLHFVDISDHSPLSLPVCLPDLCLFRSCHYLFVMFLTGSRDKFWCCSCHSWLELPSNLIFTWNVFTMIYGVWIMFSYKIVFVFRNLENI